MNNQSIVWMNVSTSAKWTRPPVGIVRVERELCRQLRLIYKERFRTCILSDGKFIEFKNDNDGDNESFSKLDKYIPDVSFDFPQLGFLDYLPAKKDILVSESIEDDSGYTRNIQYGDTLISVGLDWDWEDQRIDKIMYDLKTKRGVNVLTCCYDLIPVIYPQYCVGDVAAKFKEYFSNMIWSSTQVLCISQKTESDLNSLVDTLGLPNRATTIIPLGSSVPNERGLIKENVKKILGKKYILFVSTIERRKNHEVLYRAYHLILKENPDFEIPKLVFVGMPGWGVGDLLKDIELDPLIQDNIVQFHHVSDAELRALYINCSFFVYPSLYEGWGLPIAEALAFGKFVIASSSGSIPEVGGDLVEYIDPWRPDEWAAAIIKFSVDESLIREKEKIILEKFVPNTWRSTADVIVKAITDINLQRSNDHEIYPGFDLYTQVGIPFCGRIMSQNRDGVLAYGPYIACPAGTLSAQIELDKLGDCGGDMTIKLTFDQGKSTLVHSQFNIKDIKIGSFTIEFKEVSVPSYISDLEMFVSVDNNVNISLDKVTLYFNPLIFDSIGDIEYD